MTDVGASQDWRLEVWVPPLKTKQGRIERPGHWKSEGTMQGTIEEIVELVKRRSTEKGEVVQAIGPHGIHVLQNSQSFAVHRPR